MLNECTFVRCFPNKQFSCADVWLLKNANFLNWSMFLFRSHSLLNKIAHYTILNCIYHIYSVKANQWYLWQGSEGHCKRKWMSLKGVVMFTSFCSDLHHLATYITVYFLQCRDQNVSCVEGKTMTLKWKIMILEGKTMIMKVKTIWTWKGRPCKNPGRPCAWKGRPWVQRQSRQFLSFYMKKVKINQLITF